MRKGGLHEKDWQSYSHSIWRAYCSWRPFLCLFGTLIGVKCVKLCVRNVFEGVEWKCSYFGRRAALFDSDAIERGK